MYYDLSNVIRYYTTGGYAYGPERGIGNPVPWAKWHLILKNLDFLEDPGRPDGVRRPGPAEAA